MVMARSDYKSMLRKCRYDYDKKKTLRFINAKYTMQNIFSNCLCFASLFGHLSSILNNFNCNDENWILGK